jgi:voltage-gated potassium channel
VPSEDTPQDPLAEAARDAADAARIERWDRRARPAIVAAALLPIIASVTAGPREGLLLIVDFAGWGVFLVDLLVHVRYSRGYLKRPVGMFDLAIVIVTFPWYIIPGFENADIILLARLARVARLFMESRHVGGVRRLLERLGRAALYAAVLVVVCSLVIDKVEHGTHGFNDFGDSMWFSIVTISTVGYGDLVPSTPAGRFVAVVLMLGGIALLGALAGSLGAFLRVQDTGGDAEERVVATATTQAADDISALRVEIAEVNRRLAALQAHLGMVDDGTTPGTTPGAPPARGSP